MIETPVPASRLGPMDAHNRELLANARPPDWTNPTPEGRYNMVVLGAGTAGLVTAAGVAGLGGRAAIVERHLFGGDCLNYGCVPSKTLIAAARAAHDARRAAEYGVRVGPAEVDFAAVMERVRRVRGRISHHDAVTRFRDMGVDVFLGEARFTGGDSVEVEGRTLRFARACIATGARALRPDIEGLAEAGFHTNETIFSLTERPRRLAVLGAGPLGCEMAQAFARLGSEVTIIQRKGRLLGREDPDAAEAVERSFERDGIALELGAAIRRVTADGTGRHLELATGNGSRTVTADEILVGFGRVPNLDGLGLEQAGVEYDTRRGVKVDDRLRTTNKRIYAAGDACLKTKFTHAADATARLVIRNALFWGRGKLSALTIPWCTYTDPEVAHVGLYPRDAEQRGIEMDTFTQPFAENDRAVAEGDAAGFVRIHTEKGRDRIVGATIVGRGAGDMIGEVAVAMAGGVGLGTLGDVIHPYPTLAEAIKHAGDAYSRTRLTRRAHKVLRAVLAWRR